MFRNIWKNISGGRILRSKSDQSLPTVMINLKLWYIVEIKLPSKTGLIDEICEWLEQVELLCVVCNNTSNISCFYFVNEEDAVAFKLRWL